MSINNSNNFIMEKERKQKVADYDFEATIQPPTKVRRAFHSLPTIKQHKIQKINVIRKEVSDMEQQITSLKSRINALNTNRARFIKTKHRNQNQISFIRSVRESNYGDSMHKKSIQTQRSYQVQNLKMEAKQKRQELRRNGKQAKSLVQESKLQRAQQKRSLEKEHKEMIKKQKQENMEKKREKVEKIKKEEQQKEKKMSEYNKSRISMAKQNYSEKIVKQLFEKDRLDRILRKLRKKQKRIYQEFRNEESSMLETFNQLQALTQF